MPIKRKFLFLKKAIFFAMKSLIFFSIRLMICTAAFLMMSSCSTYKMSVNEGTFDASTAPQDHGAKRPLERGGYYRISLGIQDFRETNHKITGKYNEHQEVCNNALNCRKGEKPSEVLERSKANISYNIKDFPLNFSLEHINNHFIYSAYKLYFNPYPGISASFGKNFSAAEFGFTGSIGLDYGDAVYNYDVISSSFLTKPYKIKGLNMDTSFTYLNVSFGGYIGFFINNFALTYAINWDFPRLSDTELPGYIIEKKEKEDDKIYYKNHILTFTFPYLLSHYLGVTYNHGRFQNSLGVTLIAGPEIKGATFRVSTSMALYI